MYALGNITRSMFLVGTYDYTSKNSLVLIKHAMFLNFQVLQKQTFVMTLLWCYGYLWSFTRCID